MFDVQVTYANGKKSDFKIKTLPAVYRWKNLVRDSVEFFGILVLVNGRTHYSWNKTDGLIHYATPKPFYFIQDSLW